MAPNPEFYNSTDSATISAPITASVTAGNSLATVEYHLWNWKAGAGTTLSNSRLRAVAYDGTHKVTSGLPILDEGWVQVRLIGQTTTGDPAMLAQISPWTNLGTDRALWLDDIPANCARHVEVKIVVPSGAANNTQEIYLELVYDETSLVLGRRSALATGAGVIPDRFDSSTRRLTSGGRITASGSDVVLVGERTYVFDGYAWTSLQFPTGVTLNQTAANGALTAGQSYIGVITNQAGGVSPDLTKGNRAASPTPPATPANHIFIGYVTVAYQGGGTSIINQGNVDQTDLVYGEFWSFNSTGLNLVVGAGRAITETDTEVVTTTPSTVVVADGTDFYVSLNPDGTLTSDTQQTENSILIATGSASGGAIVTFDPTVRPRAERGVAVYVMTLRYMGAQSVGSDLDWDILPFDAVLERIYVEHGTAASGGAGSTIYDIHRRGLGGPLSAPGGSIFTNQATTDRRPTIAIGSTQTSTYPVVGHEEVESVAGSRFSLDCDAIPSGTSAIDVIAQLHFRRKR